jgi:hypothetical protein
VRERGILAALAGSLALAGVLVAVNLPPAAPDVQARSSAPSTPPWEARPLPTVTAPPGVEWCTYHCTLKARGGPGGDGPPTTISLTLSTSPRPAAESHARRAPRHSPRTSSTGG